MIRVHVICEGQTEEMFINEVLSGLFTPKGIHLYPSLIGKPGHKGGNFKFGRLLTDLRARLLGDTDAYCTTFFDFYGLPADFPGKNEARGKANSGDKATYLLQTFSERLKKEFGGDPLRRFIPYVQMHEFEGLLFSNTTALAQGIYQNSLENSFQAIRNEFRSPEEINDNSETAPSKRIKILFSEYEKVVHGSLVAIEIGLDNIRSECPLFNAWVERIEGLPKL